MLEAKIDADADKDPLALSAPEVDTDDEVPAAASEPKIDAVNSGDRYTGVVRWFDPEKGYGFITGDSEDIHVHYSGIQGEGYRILEEDQLVEYSIVDDDKEETAVNVVVLNEKTTQSSQGSDNDIVDGRRYIGVVKWFNPQKGYGFITGDSGDIHVHYSDVRDFRNHILEDGQQVEYSIGQGAKGPAAVDVVVLGS